MVNDLRTARGESMVSPGVLFSPPLWNPLPEAASRPVTLRRDLRSVVRRLRAYYEAALLAVVRAGARGVPEALMRIDEVLDRVEMLAANRPALRLWWSARAMVQELADGKLELTVAVKRLLGQLNTQLRAIADDGQAALDRRPPAELLRHILYYVATSPMRGERSGAVKTTFGLEELAEGLEAGGESGWHAGALSAVAAPLAEQLDELERRLEDDFGVDAERDSELATSVRQLAITFGLLGADDLRESLQRRAQELQDGSATGGTDRLLPLAEDMLRARAVVMSLMQARATSAPDAREVSAIWYREALTQAVAQVNTELFGVKEGLTLYAAGEAEVATLRDVAGGLACTIGVLRMLGHEGTGGLGPWVQRLHEAAGDGAMAPDRAALERLAGEILDVESGLQGIEELPVRHAWPDAVAPREAERPDLRAPDAEVPASGVTRVPTTPAPGPATTATDDGAREDAEEEDEELREIFAEEMGEVIDTLGDVVPAWSRDLGSREALMEIRRAFHTLKGSGRVVGAVEIGDFAWSVEKVLNRVIEGSMGSSAEVGELVTQATDLLPEVLGAFRSRDPLPGTAGSLRQQAEQLAP
jgi:chemosensory pili system protein ChpA (sensor histidine kinase/response regulator)